MDSTCGRALIETDAWSSVIPQDWYLVDRGDAIALANRDGSVQVMITTLSRENPKDKFSTALFVRGAEDRHERISDVSEDSLSIIIAELENGLTARIATDELAMLLSFSSTDGISDVERDFVRGFAEHLSLRTSA